MAKLGIVFTQHVRPFSAGEMAGFEKEDCERYIKQGFAKWDERLNPDGVPLPEEKLAPEIRRNRELGKVRFGGPAGMLAEGVVPRGETVEKRAGR